MPTTQRIARTIAEECACLSLRSAARAATRLYDAELRGVGLRITQLTILVGVAMFGDDGAPMKPLASAIEMDRTTLTRSLKPLLDEGHVVLVKSETDGRSRVVKLTAAGADALEGAYPLWKKAQARAMDRVGGSRLESLTRTLDEVRKRL